MVLAPDDMTDVLRDIIDHRRQRVEISAILAQEHRVGEGRAIDMALTAHEIGPADDFVVEFETPMRLAPLGFQPDPLGSLQREPGPVIDGWQATRQLALAFAIEFIGGLEARIKPPGLAQFFSGGAVKRESLRLAQNRVRHDAEPGKIDLDRLGVFLLGARDIGVIKAKNKFAMVFFCVKEVQKRRPRVANMNMTGRRWSETNDWMRHECPKVDGIAKMRNPPEVTLLEVRAGVRPPRVSNKHIFILSHFLNASRYPLRSKMRQPRSLTMTMAYAAVWFCLCLTSLNLISIGIAGLRARPNPKPFPAPRAGPGVSIVRPLCGLDNFCNETLELSFRLDYPTYEIIFCVARANDPVVLRVQRMMANHPDLPARLIVGDEKVSANPKLNNCVRGWDAARHDWIILADANVLMPQDYIQRLLAGWRRRTGLVCSMPLGSRPGNIWAELECAFLNTFEARWQYCAEAMGLGFAQGKSMLWRRDIMDNGGGIRALNAEIIEDAAATKLARRQGLTVNLVDSPFEQPLGARAASEVWLRQLRWARTRRKTFPLFYAPEIFAGAALPCLAAAYAAWMLDLNVAAATLGIAAVWYVPEALLARHNKWYFSWRVPLLFILRDAILPLVYIDAWCTDHFVWRGNEMTMRAEEASAEGG